MRCYVLDEHGNPQKEDDPLAWAKWWETHNYRLAIDVFMTKDLSETIRVSTIFLGKDQRLPFSFVTKPILWETIIFGGLHDLRRWRYTSLADAKAGHAYAVNLVKTLETRWLLAQG